MKKLNKKGFTIVELVIVIAVIAILAAVLIPTFSGVVKKANASAALQEAKNAYTVIVAEDIADGLQDGRINKGDSVTLTGFNGTITYTCDGGKCTLFKMVNNNGYTATINVESGAWTVTEPNA